MPEIIKKSHTVKEDAFVHVVPPGASITCCGLAPDQLIDEGFAVPSCPDCFKEMDVQDIYARYRVAVSQRDEYATALRSIRNDMNLAGFDHTGTPELKHEAGRVKKLIDTHIKHRKMVIKSVTSRNAAVAELEQFKNETSVQIVESSAETITEKPLKQESPVTKVGQMFNIPDSHIPRALIEIKQWSGREWYVFDLSTTDKKATRTYLPTMCQPVEEANG